MNPKKRTLVISQRWGDIGKEIYRSIQSGDYDSFTIDPKIRVSSLVNRLTEAGLKEIETKTFSSRFGNIVIPNWPPWGLLVFDPARDLVGEGALSEVYRARVLDGNARLESPLALKIIIYDRDSTYLKMTSAQREIDALMLASNSAPEEIRKRVVMPIDTYFTPSYALILMKYYQGSLNDGIPKTWDRKRLYSEFLSIAKVLHWYQKKGIYHNDVKPSNILLDERSQAVLSDFSHALPASIEFFHVPLGTPSYMPPERAQMKRFHPTSDVFSLVATLYAVVSGKSFFRSIYPKSGRDNFMNFMINYGEHFDTIKKLVETHLHPDFIPFVQESPEKRPGFDELIKLLENLREETHDGNIDDH